MGSKFRKAKNDLFEIQRETKPKELPNTTNYFHLCFVPAMTTLVDFVFPPVGSVLSFLNVLRTRYSQLKEGSELCTSLHGRLEDAIRELNKIDNATLQYEGLLQQFVDLIQEYAITVTKYAGERNIVKRAWNANKFTSAIEAYNERWEHIMRLIAIKQSVTIVEWRNEYREDTATLQTMIVELASDKKEIWKAMNQISNPRDVYNMALIMKRDITEPESPEQSLPPLDRALRNIVSVAEKFFLNQKLEKPPTWLIAGDEITTLDAAIDNEGLTKIFVGEWQGVQVAVKVFNIAGDNPVFDKHFNVWRALLHPHVAQLYGAGSREGAPFFVYEHAIRQSLDRCWDQMSAKEVWRILHQAALGLSYLHKNHVVHGNLSCSKLLVNGQGDTKLFGFGASYIRENGKSNSIKPQTREEFNAPECIGIDANGMDNGLHHSPCFESDVYMFGLTIIEAVTKKDPFHGMYPKDIRNMKRTRLPCPNDLSDEVWSLVSLMCLCDPKQRASLAHVTRQLWIFAST